MTENQIQNQNSYIGFGIALDISLFMPPSDYPHL